jgi:hypothetical protein
LSRLQQAAPAFFANKITIQIMALTCFQLGGTVVAKYWACSECFAGSVSEKIRRRRKGAQQDFSSRLSACCPGESILNF